MNIFMIILTLLSVVAAVFSYLTASNTNKKLARLRRRYDYLLRGRGDLNLEELITQFGTELDDFKTSNSIAQGKLGRVEAWIQKTDTDQTAAINEKYQGLARQLTSQMDTTTSQMLSNMKRLDEVVFAQMDKVEKDAKTDVATRYQDLMAQFQALSADFGSRIKKNEENIYANQDAAVKGFQALEGQFQALLQAEEAERKDQVEELSVYSSQQLKAYHTQTSESMQGLDQRLSQQMGELEEVNKSRWDSLEGKTQDRLDEMEETSKRRIEDVEKATDDRLTAMEEENKENLRHETGLLKDQLYTAFQKMGLVRYNAFEDLVGEFSFSLALLDEHRNGFILTSIYGRQSSNTFAKTVKNGECAQAMSPEEEEALDQALAR